MTRSPWKATGWPGSPAWEIRAAGMTLGVAHDEYTGIYVMLFEPWYVKHQLRAQNAADAQREALTLARVRLAEALDKFDGVYEKVSE